MFQCIRTIPIFATSCAPARTLHPLPPRLTAVSPYPQHFTTGINCESCLPGYYRPAGVARDDPQPCRRCLCDAEGATGDCVPDDGLLKAGQVTIARIRLTRTRVIQDLIELELHGRNKCDIRHGTKRT